MKNQKEFKGVPDPHQFLICPRINYNSLNRKSLPGHWHYNPFPLLHNCGSDFQDLSSLRVEIQKFSVTCENSALNLIPKAEIRRLCSSKVGQKGHSGCSSLVSSLTIIACRAHNSGSCRDYVHTFT